MNKKNIILALICLIIVFFIYKNFSKNSNQNSSYNEELIKWNILGDWLIKKNVEESTLYIYSKNLTKVMEDKGIKMNNNIKLSPGNTFSENMKKANDAHIKSIIFNEGIRLVSGLEELQVFLNSGGIMYLKIFTSETNENEQLFQLLLSFVKKGQVCVVLPKYAEIDVRNLSAVDRIMAENLFVDDSNFIEFEKWHNTDIEGKAPPKNHH